MFVTFIESTVDTYKCVKFLEEFLGDKSGTNVLEELEKEFVLVFTKCLNISFTLALKTTEGFMQLDQKAIEILDRLLKHFGLREIEIGSLEVLVSIFLFCKQHGLRRLSIEHLAYLGRS